MQTLAGARALAPRVAVGERHASHPPASAPSSGTAARALGAEAVRHLPSPASSGEVSWMASAEPTTATASRALTATYAPRASTALSWMIA